MDASRGALDDLLSAGPVTWLLTGDSITEGWGLDHPRFGYAGLFADHLRTHAGAVRARDAVHNSGVAGATVDDALGDFDTRVERHGADIVSILFGMNEAAWGAAGVDRFRDGMGELVSRVVALGALPVLQTPYPEGPGGEGTHDALPACVEVIRELAATVGAPLVDHFAHWADLDERWGWYADPWHVDERGHAELARFMIETLLGNGRSPDRADPGA